MIPVSTLYDEYIDRPKLTEQKKPVEYIVPPPSKGVGTKKLWSILCHIWSLHDYKESKTREYLTAKGVHQYPHF